MGIIILRPSEGPLCALCVGWECPAGRGALGSVFRDETPAHAGRGRNRRPDHRNFIKKSLRWLSAFLRKLVLCGLMILVLYLRQGRPGERAGLPWGGMGWELHTSVV